MTEWSDHVMGFIVMRFGWALAFVSASARLREGMGGGAVGYHPVSQSAASNSTQERRRCCTAHPTEWEATGVVMTREELLDVLWENAAVLDDKQLEIATIALEELAYPRRAPRRHLVDAEATEAKTYGEFVAELRARLQTTDETT